MLEYWVSGFGCQVSGILQNAEGLCSYDFYFCSPASEVLTYGDSSCHSPLTHHSINPTVHWFETKKITADLFWGTRLHMLK